jgi:hypothetical protein
LRLMQLLAYFSDVPLAPSRRVMLNDFIHQLAGPAGRNGGRQSPCSDA